MTLYVGSDGVDLSASDIEEVLSVRHFVCDEDVLLQVSGEDGGSRDRSWMRSLEDKRDAPSHAKVCIVDSLSPAPPCRSHTTADDTTTRQNLIQ